MATASPDPPILNVQLLGGFRLHDGEHSFALLHSDRQQALLAYLLLNHGAPQPRARIAAAFWPDSSEARAYSSLRNLLHQVRQSLPLLENFLAITPHSVVWLDSAPFNLDVDDFEAAMRLAEAATNPAAQKAALERAVTIYRGELLPECYEDWIAPDRTRLQRHYWTALERLVELCDQLLEYKVGIRYAWRLQQVDPLAEESYRHLMRLYDLTGNRSEAIRCYNLCASVLERELGVEPDAVTQDLYARLLRTPVVQEKPARTGTTEQPATSLIGRRDEWQQLLQAWRTTTTGTAQLLLLSGEAGIGKTHLASAFVHWAERLGHTVASAQCYPTEGTLAYAPILTWLRAAPLRTQWEKLDEVWLSELALLLPEAAPAHLRRRVRAPSGENWQRTRLFDALVQAMLTQEDPVLLLLEDLQWCDRESLEWLHYLLRQRPHAPLLLLATLRTEELSADAYVATWLLELRHKARLVEIELARLDQNEAMSLVQLTAGHPLAVEEQAALYANTEGNPLFIVESVRAGLIAVGPSSEPTFRLAHLPPRIKAVLEARLATLSAPARTVVEVAAVIGRAFTHQLLVSAAGGDEAALVRALDELWRRRILRVHEEVESTISYDFSHEKLREVAYLGLGPTQRSYWHRHVGEALTKNASGDLEIASGEAAVHFQKGGSYYQALHHYILAAEQAAKVYAYYRAEEFYARAIAVSTHLNLANTEIVQLYSGRGRVLELAGRYADALTVYQELEELARRRGEAIMERVAIEHLVTCYVEPSSVHDIRQAEALSERGIKLARVLGDVESEVRFLRTRMVAASHYGRDEDGRAAGEAGIALARQHGLQEQLAYVLNDLAIQERLSGWLEQGQEHAGEARVLFQASNNLPMFADNLAQQAWSDLLCLRSDAAVEYAEEAEALCRRIGNSWNLSIALLVRGVISALRGEWAVALMHLRAGAREADVAGLVATQTVIPLRTGVLYRELGDLDRAQTLHLQAHTTACTRAPFLLHAVEAQLAINAFDATQVEEGARWFAAAQEHMPRGAIGRAWFTLADVANAAVAGGGSAHGWEVALRTVEDGLAEAKQRRLDYFLPELLLDKARCLAGLKRQAEAVELLQELLSLAQLHRLDALLWKGHAALGEIYRSQGRLTLAQSAEERASAMVRQFTQGIEDSNLRTSIVT
jgi:DNA-binding SARP family transcriptional activator/tetratricopeptide (TPR) repeat protein